MRALALILSLTLAGPVWAAADFPLPVTTRVKIRAGVAATAALVLQEQQKTTPVVEPVTPGACPACGGTGRTGDGLSVCPKCKGTGRVGAPPPAKTTRKTAAVLERYVIVAGAPWCHHCKEWFPRGIEEGLRKQGVTVGSAPSFQVWTFNIDTDDALRRRLRVSAVPQLLLIERGYIKLRVGRKGKRVLSPQDVIEVYHGKVPASAHKLDTDAQAAADNVTEQAYGVAAGWPPVPAHPGRHWRIMSGEDVATHLLTTHRAQHTYTPEQIQELSRAQQFALHDYLHNQEHGGFGMLLGGLFRPY